VIFLRHQRALAEFGLTSLARRPTRAALLGVVLTTIVFVLSSLAFLASSVRQHAAAVLRDAPELVVQRVVAERQDLMPATAVAVVQAVPGVREARGRLWGYYYNAASGDNYTVVVPARPPLPPGHAMLGAGVARTSRTFGEGAMWLRSYAGEPMALTVHDVLAGRSDLLTADLVLVSERDFRALFTLPAGFVNDVVVALVPGSDAEAVRRAIGRALPDVRVVTRREMLSTATSFLDGRSGLTAVVIGAMVLGLVILSGDKPSALGDDERREMGTLRALGWTAADVLIAKVWESLAVSMTALFVGALAAYAHIYVFGAALFVPVLKGWAALSPELHLAPALNIPAFAGIAASTLVLPAAGMLLACFAPATGNPDSVIRE
jgi:hypothetical protein